VFVQPDLVEGTLRRGHELLASLPDPFQRAVFVMFLVTEVHPFDDGNGRVARIMMNAELVAAERRRIVIPTVFRNDYVSALKAVTHNRAPEALIRSLAFAQRYTQAVDFAEWDRALVQLRATNAFLDPGTADAAGIRLVLPA
jgi:Fic family protein